MEVAEADGGSGYGLAGLGVLLEEAGRTLAPIPLVPTLVYSAPALGEFGSADQRQRWLPGVVAGDILLSAAFEESGRQDPARPQTKARAQGEGWVLDGEKICVPCAAQAARILVPASLGEGLVGVFLVDPNAPGVGLEAGIANHHERQFQLTLTGVEVQADDLLGSPENGAEIVTSSPVVGATLISIDESSVKDLPGFINIHTVRHFWHSGTGTDGPPEWDRYHLIKNEMAHLGLQDKVKQIETETTFQAEQIWEKQLQKLSAK